MYISLRIGQKCSVVTNYKNIITRVLFSTALCFICAANSTIGCLEETHIEYRVLTSLGVRFTPLPWKNLTSAHWTTLPENCKVKTCCSYDWLIYLFDQDCNLEWLKMSLRLLLVFVKGLGVGDFWRPPLVMIVSENAMDSVRVKRPISPWETHSLSIRSAHPFLITRLSM